tara:strand:- start:219 stop:983 length:765 start_codon:yes stop_codon:yes gene_type:complete
MVWNPGVGRDDQGYLPSHTSYDPGHKSESDRPQYNTPAVSHSQHQQTNLSAPLFGGYKNAQQQLAASLKAAGAVTSGALGGQALWTKGPKQWEEDIRNKGGDPNLYANEYFSSFAEGTQAYSPTGIMKITGEGGVPAYKGRDPKTGKLIPWDKDDWQYEFANKYQVVNPYGSDPRGSDNFFPSNEPGYGYGYGGGGGSGGYGYGYGEDEDPFPRGYQRGKVGPGGLLEAVNKLLFRLSGLNKKRGGIVSLLELS